MSDYDEMVDLVVVGSGGGSMCAGLLMRSAGKSAVILAKTDLVGGTTARSGGVMWIPDNPFMRRDGVDDSYEKAVTYLDTLVGDHEDTPGATRARRHAYLREAPRMVDFLLGQGIKPRRVSYWPDYYDELPGGSAPGRTVVAEPFDLNQLGPWKAKLRPGFLMMPATLEEAMLMPRIRFMGRARRVMFKVALRAIAGSVTRKRRVAAGMALQGWMFRASLRAGVDIRTDAPVSELIVENQAVKGVPTVKDGKPWRVGARLGVLVNAGGFAHNQRMRDQYIPGTSTAWTGAAPGDTGEMIEEMMRHGAAIAQMDERVGNQNTLSPGSETAFIRPGAQGMKAAPHAILVDQGGVRYMNEGGSYVACCKGMLVRNKVVPAVPSWMIFDSQYTRRYLLAGTMPSEKNLQRWHEAGYLERGDRIAALAEDTGIDPQVLAATIARFNGFVAQNHDADFHRGERAYDRWLGDSTHRPSETLGTIEKGPFDEFIAPVRALIEDLAIGEMRHYWWKSIPIPSNWKVAQDAFFETYHVPATQLQLEKPAAAMIYGSNRPTDFPFSHRHVAYDAFAYGHGRFYAGEKMPMAGSVQPQGGDPVKAMAARLKLLADGMDAQVLQGDIDVLLTLRGKPWGGEIFIFPNVMILPHAGNAMIYRVRPAGSDPDRCAFEIFSTRSYPAAVTPPRATLQRVTDLEDPEQVLEIPRQDLGNIPRMQKGLHSRAMRQTWLASHHEKMILDMHQEMDRYLQA